MSVHSKHLLILTGALVALGGCETVAEETTEAVGHEFVADLMATNGGASMGKAEISLNDATNMLCTDLELNSGVTMTAGHLVGPGNATIADIDRPDDNDGPGDNDSEDCDNVTDAVVDSIRANPGAYWVHIAAASGDLRGTLRREAD
jgi:hypothetical protein